MHAFELMLALFVPRPNTPAAARLNVSAFLLLILYSKKADSRGFCCIAANIGSSSASASIALPLILAKETSPESP